MRTTNKLLLVLAALVLFVSATLLVASAENTDRTTPDPEMGQDTISYELLYFYAPPATPPGLLPDCEPREPGFNPYWSDTFEGPSELSLLYAYGFADRYGRLNYELPGYSVEEQIDFADAYVIYAHGYIYDDSAEVLEFREFIQAFEDSGESDLSSFLFALLEA